MSRQSMARSKKSKGMSVSSILSLAIIILLALGLGLWLMKENAPAPNSPIPQIAQPLPQGTTLPSRPEEVYSYIRDLETREVITYPNKGQPKSAQLSKEQLAQLEEKRKQEEAARLAAEPIEPEVAREQPAVPSDAEIAAQKAREQKLAEEKRKQAELKKQQELAAKKAEAEKAKAKVEPTKTEQAKVISAKSEEKPTASHPKPGSFGLQCGAFKNKAQAENMQARLAMAGFNARIVSGADWNRVFVGPVGNRSAAATAQSNARSVAECVIVAM